MPAGQVYRLTRVQRQQQRLFDPNLLGLQLTDETALNTVPAKPGNGYLQRYRGRQQWQQWPVLSRLDATGLELADQPDIDLLPWTPPTATYQRYRGKPQQAQWPVYPRADATTLQLADQDVTLRPAWAPWLRPARTAQWRQPAYWDISNYPSGIPNQPDIDLIPWQQTTASYLRWRGRVWNQWPVYARADATTLQLADQDVNLVPVSARMWRPPSRATFQQFFPTDPSGLELADLDITLRPINVLWQQRKGRAQYQQFAPTDPNEFATGLPDQDVNLVPVSARMWRPPSRASFQQFAPLVLLNDQDVTFLPVPITTAYALRKSRAPFQQFHPTDPVGLELADQDVRLVPVMSPSSTFLRYRGKQLWLVRTVFPSTTTVIIVGPTLVPPLSTVFLSDGSMVTFTTDTGIRATVITDDGRRATQAATGFTYTDNLNP